MTTARVLFLTVAALATALTLSACAGASPAADSSSSPTASAFNGDDVMFAQLMIGHHEQAVEMSDDDMMQLRDASGADAGALYLTQMIMHHQGAIAMAEDELSDGEPSL